MKFEQITLNEVISSANTGADAIKKAPIVDCETNFRCLRIGDISNNREFEKWGFTSADEKIQEKFGLKKDDVMIARTGNTIGVSTIIEEDINAVFNNGLIRLKIKHGFEPLFIYYLVSSKAFKDFIGQISGGTSTQPNVKIQYVLQFPIPNWNIKKQKKFVSILRSFDLKIKSNLVMIKKFEEISQTLFKHWFIDFEFPNEEGLPYKSSGGKIMESELGEIPEGWGVGAMKDICLLSSEKINLDKEEHTYNYIGLEHMPQGNIALGNWESSEKVSGNKGVFNKGDILFGKLRPYFKKVGITAIDGVCSTDILVLKPKNDFEKSYLLVNLIQDKFIEYTSSTATGTRMPRTGWNQISRYNIVIPFTYLLVKFNEIVKPMLEQIQELIHENVYLKQVRDSLLPKLLSGEIEIPDESVVDSRV